MQIDWTKYVDEDDEGDDFDTSGMVRPLFI
jgi:hypothetical protein